MEDSKGREEGGEKHDGDAEDARGCWVGGCSEALLVGDEDDDS